VRGVPAHRCPPGSSTYGSRLSCGARVSIHKCNSTSDDGRRQLQARVRRLRMSGCRLLHERVTSHPLRPVLQAPCYMSVSLPEQLAMKRLVFIPTAGVVLLQACGASTTVSGNLLAPVPKSATVAILSLEFADPSIARVATDSLHAILGTSCRDLMVLAPDTVAERMSAARVVVPRQLNRVFFEQFASAVHAEYLLSGGIIRWEKGRAHFPVATETEVQISLSLYDVSTSELIWSVTGSQKGGGGIFANDPASTARKLFDQMLEKLPNFCRRGAPGP